MPVAGAQSSSPSSLGITAGKSAVPLRWKKDYLGGNVRGSSELSFVAAVTPAAEAHVLAGDLLVRMEDNRSRRKPRQRDNSLAKHAGRDGAPGAGGQRQANANDAATEWMI
jgi:hypothetical protein